MNFIPKIEYIELGSLTPKTITFDSPPNEDPFNEEYAVDATITKSNNGRRQTQFNYIEKSYTLEFIFQSETVKAAILDFYNNHALRGGAFNYFPSSDELDNEEFYLADRGLELDRPIPVGDFSGQFEYDFKIKIERVI
jgi:hypothetical protein